jgi:hypothetical protein
MRYCLKCTGCNREFEISCRLDDKPTTHLELNTGMISKKIGIVHGEERYYTCDGELVTDWPRLKSQAVRINWIRTEDLK